MMADVQSVNIAIVGDKGSGKTSLLNCYLNGRFNENEEPTYGIGIGSKDTSIEINQVPEHVIVSFNESCGEKQFWATTISVLKSADAILIVYDTNEENSLERVKYWIDKIASVTSEKLIALAGNKIETPKFNGNACSSIDELAKKNKIKSHWVSAKEDNGVTDLFKYLIIEAIYKAPSRQSSMQSTV